MNQVGNLGVRGALTRCVTSLALLVLLASVPGSAFSQESGWDSLDVGLELGRFKVRADAPVGDSTIVVLRINPAAWKLKLLSISEIDKSSGSTARKWCEKHNLVAAINAGMFMTDYRTHVGYMQSGKHINCASVNKYESAAAFDRLRPDIPDYRLFDLDETSLDSIIARYGGVVQNLRLIKRPRENRWSQQDRKWSEAALGEDRDGNILFIFCRSPYSMYDFNRMLLSLPIDLVCAQHLEGGPEAQLYFKVGNRELELSGSYETGFMEGSGNLVAWPIPNVLGLVRKSE